MAKSIIDKILGSFYVDKSCWVWTGSINPTSNYGRVYFDSKQNMAHRVMYELLVGDIPNGLQLDHLCRNRSCVNPEHLEPVTIRQNLLRSNITNATINKNKTHCSSGHEFSKKNTYNRKDKNSRECRICRKAAVIKYNFQGGY